MILLGLLLFPTIIVIYGIVKSSGAVTPKEAAVQFVVQTPLIAVGLWTATWGQSLDTEIWNGVIAKKFEDTGSCCHDYKCNPHPCSCDAKGQNCSTCYDTCYEHSRDTEWYAVSSNGETVYSDTCNRPGSSAPSRWNQIRVGEPTAVEHGYTNYIKGNPGSVLRMQGMAEQYRKAIPAYPSVYDHYRIRRFLTVGVRVPNADALDARLAEINAKLGARKQVNITTVIVNEGSRGYIDGLREAWIGGKKNDIVVVVGAPRFPEIAWAGVMSWSDNETMKIVIRDRIQRMRTFDGDQFLNIVEEEVADKFVRKAFKDFDYLKATVQPPEWAVWLLFFLGLAISIGLQIYFWKHDPFDCGRRYRR